MVQYNLHYLIKKTSHINSSHFEWSAKNRKTHLVLICAGLLFVIAGFLNFKLNHFILLVILVIITLIYSIPVLPSGNKKRLKDYGILKIITLVLLWTVITVWFPADQIHHNGKQIVLFFIRRFVFLFALCLVFDLRDIDIDTKEDIKTVPVIIGVKQTHSLINVFLVVFILLTLIQFVQTSDVSGLNAMILSAAATFVTIEYVKKNRSDIAYLACIDGMMLLQTLLVIISSI